MAPGQQWLAVCTAVTSASRQDIPRLPWPRVHALAVGTGGEQWVLGAVPGHCGCRGASAALHEPGAVVISLHNSRGHCQLDVVGSAMALACGEGSEAGGLCAYQEWEGWNILDKGSPLVLGGLEAGQKLGLGMG